MADAWAKAALALVTNLNLDRAAILPSEAVNELGDGYMPGVVSRLGDVWAISGNDAPIYVSHTGDASGGGAVDRVISFLNTRNVPSLTFIQGAKLLEWNFPKSGDPHDVKHVTDPKAVCGIDDAIDIALQSQIGICVLHIDGRLTCAEDVVGTANCATLTGAGVKAPMTPQSLAQKIVYADTCVLDQTRALLCRPWAAHRGNIGSTFLPIPDATNITRVIGRWDSDICVENSGASVCFNLETRKMRPFSELPSDATMPTLVNDAFGLRFFYLRGGAIHQAVSGAGSPFDLTNIAPPQPGSDGVASFRVYGNAVLAIPKSGTSLLYWDPNLPKSATMLSIPLYRSATLP